MAQEKLIIFDLDGTLIDDTIYIWKTLHEHFETDPLRRRQAYQDYRAGKIDYNRWAQIDLELLKDRNVSRNDIDALFENLKLVPNARETLLSLKNRSWKMAVISGSVDRALYSVLPDADELFDDVFINVLKFDKKGFLQDIVPTPFDMEHKAAGLHFLADKYNINIQDVVFVGDNDNDVHIAREAGMSIAFNSKSRQLERVSTFVVAENDLRIILTWV